MSTTRTLARRLAAVSAAVGLAAGALVAGAPAAQAASTTCAQDCVGDMVGAVSADRFTLDFTTGTPTHVVVTVSGGATSFTLEPAGAYYASSFSLDTATHGLLTQGYGYEFTVVATDQLGNSWKEGGWFLTRHRSVTVSWDNLTIDNDSDVVGLGSVVGATRASLSCPITSLYPLSRTVATAVTTGGSITPNSGATFTCTDAPSAFTVSSLLIDDDSSSDPVQCAGQFPPNLFTPAGMVTSGKNACMEWTHDTAYVADLASQVVNGTHVVPITMVGSALSGPTLAYTLTGKATFTITGGDLQLPAAAKAAPVTLATTVTPGDGRVDVAWTVPALVAQPAGYVLLARPVGTALWTLASSGPATSFTFLSLTNGTAYELVVRPVDGAGHGFASTTVTATPIAPPVVVTPPAAVPPAAVPPVVAPPAAPPVVVPTVIPTTKVAGFATRTTSSKLRIGKLLTLVTVVSPGAGRLVVVQYRPAGKTVWKKFTVLKANAKGVAVVTLVGVKGVRSWRLVVPATAKGTIAISKVRVVRGMR